MGLESRKKTWLQDTLAIERESTAGDINTLEKTESKKTMECGKQGGQTFDGAHEYWERDARQPRTRPVAQPNRCPCDANKYQHNQFHQSRQIPVREKKREEEDKEQHKGGDGYIGGRIGWMVCV